MTLHPAKTQINLGICPVWSDSLLSAWRKLESLATHRAHREDSDQTGRMPRLIWVVAGRTVILLVLSRGGSFDIFYSIGYTDWNFFWNYSVLSMMILPLCYWKNEIKTFFFCVCLYGDHFLYHSDVIVYLSRICTYCFRLIFVLLKQCMTFICIYRVKIITYIVWTIFCFILRCNIFLLLSHVTSLVWNLISNTRSNCK